MKLQADTYATETMGVSTAATPFTILASGKAFRALADTLYSNKVLAVVREVVCNALDANLSVGKKTEPVVVHLPTMEEPYFSVKDNGTGLSHDFMLTRYAALFDSTKNDSNESIGGFGIGRLSFFAYTDTYSVASRQNGIKRTYSIYSLPNGQPAVQPMTEEPTDECDGLEVFGAVESKDFTAFRESAKAVFSRLEVKPTVTGVFDFMPNVFGAKYQGMTDWSIRDNGGRAMAVMGNIAYPIEVDAALMSKEENSVLALPLELNCNIGDIEIALSREKLSFNPTSIDYLKARLAEIITEIRLQFETKMAAAKNVWEAKLILWDLQHGEFSCFAPIIRAHGIEWRGEKITLGNIVPSMTLPGVSVRRFYRKNKRGGGLVISKSVESDITVSRKVEVIVDDLDKGSMLRTRYFTETNPHLESVYLVSKPEVASDADFLKAIGREGDALKKVSEMPRPPRNASSITAKGAASFLSLDFDADGDAADFWEAADDVDLEEGGIYVNVDRYCIHASGFSLGKPKSFIRELYSLSKMFGFDIKDLEIIGVKSRANHKIINNPKWVSITNYIKEKITKSINSPEFIEAMSLRRAEESVESVWITDHLTRFEKIVNTDGVFKSFLSKLRNFKESIKKYSDDFDTMYRRAQGFSATIPVIPPCSVNFKEEYKIVAETYPMIAAFEEAHYYVNDAMNKHGKAFADYIHQIDTQNSLRLA